MSITQLQRQVDALETRLAKVEAELQQSRTVASLSEQPPSPRTHSSQKKEYKKSGFRKTIDICFLWLRTDWLMKLGALLLLLAVAWFVNFAFVHNWVGPTARIILGIVAGVLIFLWGYWQIPKYEVPGQVLVGTGGTMVLVTLYAARNIYAMFRPSIALLCMSIVIVALAVAATRRKSVAIAYVSLIGGAMVPLLINSPHIDYTSLLTYVLLLNIGTGIVVAFRGWRHIIFAALIITALYSTVFTQMSGVMLWLFIVVFFSIFFASSITAILFEKKSRSVDIYTFTLNGMLLLWWVRKYVVSDGQVLVLIFAALLMLMVTTILRKRRKEVILAQYLAAALSIVYIAAATAMAFEGPTLAIVASLEAFFVVLSAHAFFKEQSVLDRVSLVYTVPVLLSLSSIFQYPTTGSIIHGEFFVITFLIVSLGGVLGIHAIEKDRVSTGVLHIFFGLTVAYTCIFVWLFAHNLFDSENVARAVSLVLYTMAGVLCIFRGAKTHRALLQTTGSILIGLVVLRLLLVEVWDMVLAGRIITFLTIGGLLISTAYAPKSIQKK